MRGIKNFLVKCVLPQISLALVLAQIRYNLFLFYSNLWFYVGKYKNIKNLKELRIH